MAVQRLAGRAQAQCRGLLRRHVAVPLVAHVQQVDTPQREESDAEGCQALFTDGQESDDANAALVVPEKETDDARLGTGKGGIVLPKASSNADLLMTQAKGPDCLRYMPPVNKPRAQWPSHLAAAPIHFLYVAGVLCVHVDDVVRRGIDAEDEETGRKSRSRRTPPFLGRPRIVLPAAASQLLRRTLWVG